MSFQTSAIGVIYVSIMAAGFIFLSSPFEYMKDSQAVQQINNHYMEMEAVALGIDLSDDLSDTVSS